MTNVGKAARTSLLIVALMAIAVGGLLSPILIRILMFQPYTIPSAADEPTLREGDYVVVSKNAYGYSRHSIPFSPPVFKGRSFFRAPIRGDVVVFKLPRDGRTDYIKRLIGMPGDRIQMRKGQLYINDRPVAEHVERTIVTHDRGGAGAGAPPEQATLQTETNPEGRQYLIQVHGPNELAANTGIYVVPPHCYFMLGDNRDNSLDSRFDPGLPSGDPKLGGCAWDSRADAALPFIDPGGVGFVPEENLVGRAWIAIRRGSDGVFRALTIR